MKTRIEFANTLRGIAACLVLAEHYTGFFRGSRQVIASISNTPVLSETAVPGPPYLAHLQISHFSSSSFGVALFFLISGFVIPLSLRDTGVRAFAISRIFRILPTYLVGFSITLLALLAASWFYGRDFPYSARDVAVHYFVPLRQIFGTAYIDYIIWTLEIEVDFYLMCAIAIALFRRASPLVFLIPIVIGVSSIALCASAPQGTPIFDRANDFSYILVLNSKYLIFMFIGVVFNFHYRSSIGTGQLLAWIAGLYTLFALTWHFNIQKALFQMIWSYAAAVLTFGAAYRWRGLFKPNLVTSFLADISYPLYVVHGIAGYVFMRLLFETSIPQWVVLPLTIAVFFSIAWLVHRYVEAPSQRFGKEISARSANRQAGMQYSSQQ